MSKINLKFLSLSKIYSIIFANILEQDSGIDPEVLLELSLSILGRISDYRHYPITQYLLNNSTNDLRFKDVRLQQRLFNCTFKNPLGLAAGFDKNGIAAGIWDYFGFGFAELGTVTWEPQSGNPKPRLFRLASEKAALNRMGFNNNGAMILRETLNRQKIAEPGFRPIILGLNLGKSKNTPIEKAYEDYMNSLEMIAPYADYVVINISSPNTKDLRTLQNYDELKILIKALKSIAKCPPLLIKIAPDLNDHEIENISMLSIEENIAGIIAVDTSINRLGLGKRVIYQTGQTLDQEQGGLSGKPLRDKANYVIKHLYKATKNNIPLIGVGGIHNPETAWERINAGASLIQIYTGWIFEGPLLVPKILKGLLIQLEKHGASNIHDVIGKELPWL